MLRIEAYGAWSLAAIVGRIGAANVKPSGRVTLCLQVGRYARHACIAQIGRDAERILRHAQGEAYAL